MNSSKSELLNQGNKDSLNAFTVFLDEIGITDIDNIKEIASQTVKYLKSNGATRSILAEEQELETRWYSSVKAGSPDYGVYSSRYYLAELWACWIVYSRKYLIEIEKKKIITTVPGKILDLGCGFGYTTTAIKQLFPDSIVCATNIRNTVQYQVAEKLSKQAGFILVEKLEELPPGIFDVVIGFEYFEHIEDPIGQLNEIITRFSPRILILANSFNTQAIGHFPIYSYKGSRILSKDISKLFNLFLKYKKYRLVRTGMWNNRPSVWVRV